MATENLQQQRARVERTIFDQKKQRGIALLDGTEFDATKLAAAEAALEAIADAAAEADRRENVANIASNREGYAAQLAAYAQAHERRVAGMAKAETLAHQLGAALREVLDAAAVGCAVGSDLARWHLPGGTFSEETQLTRQNFGQRLAGHLKATLRVELGSPFLGGLSLASAVGEPGPDDWAGSEAVHNSHASYARRAPAGGVAMTAADNVQNNDVVSESVPESSEDARDEDMEVSEATTVRESPGRASQSTRYSPKDSRRRGLKRNAQLVAADASFER